MSQSTARHHAEWLSLIEVSGPFLSLPVLMDVFPQGLDADDTDHARDLRLAMEEWQDNQLGPRPRTEMHRAWIDFVLANTLELPDEVVARGQDIPQSLKATVSEHHEELRPDIVIRNPEDGEDARKPRLLIKTYPLSQDLEKPVPDKRWKASPDTRMMELLHSTDIELGLVTNGERWMLVYAPRGETTGFASWYASLWHEERLTLRAFRSLLGVHRFFAVPAEETLRAMLEESAENQEEVTDQLGLQVRNAVEMLIQSLDRADRDRDRALLADISVASLYEAALTVMMRLVFLLCAEERGLLLLDDPVYDENYAISTLCDQLQASADELGEEVLERRCDAWSRLLSTFRAVYGGVQHERMRLPAYRGGLFDPDRFPFLEGRPEGTSWRECRADPLPVDNRTVLHMLQSLQYLRMSVPGGGEAESRRLSFRSLDIEQIGHVYEGLLDHTAKRATEDMVGLQGTKNQEPEVPVRELEEAMQEGQEELVDYLRDQTGRTRGALKNGLKPDLESHDVGRLLVACDGDEELRERVQPFAGLLRDGTFGYPFVIPEDSVFVTEGTDRRTSGTHYTPRSLTEPIVKHTLEPLVYDGPAEGEDREDWELKSAAELLDLNICDMACGSGAFLVQACRYLSARLAEAWEAVEEELSGRAGVTPYGKPATGNASETLIPTDPDERMVYARRLVAQRCLYGVDKNPLAVEMAKLSLWLLTLAKNKPFEFLDHAIRPGDSLVGITDLGQLRAFNLDGKGQQNRVILQFLRKHVNKAVELRRRIAEHPANTPQEVEAQKDLMKRAEEHTDRLKYAADMLVSAEFRGENKTERESALTDASIEVASHFNDSPLKFLRKQASEYMGGRPTFHWPLEFPEVMVERGGFDAFVCNPPFMGGQKITGNFGREYREYLVERLADGERGSADLCAYFFLRAAAMMTQEGQLGFLATNTISQGDTREVGLDQLTSHGFDIPRAEASRKWPGQANLQVAVVHLRYGVWQGEFHLNGLATGGITSYLRPPGAFVGDPHQLAANADKAFIGSYVLGMGFVLEPPEAQQLIDADPDNKDVLFPYLGGQDLNSQPDQAPSRWVINFFDWPLDRDTADDEYDGPVAADYPDCLSIVEREVKPQRERLRGRNPIGTKRANYWWQYGADAKTLYKQIDDLSYVLVCPIVTKYLSFTRVQTGIVFMHKLCVVPDSDASTLGLLNSAFHEAWAREHSSTLETRLNYSPSDCFETFPMPTLVDDDDLAVVSREWYSHRQTTLRSLNEGLTDAYNRFHDPNELTEAIQRLRQLHVKMDYAVAAAYGWEDIDLGHDFHTTQQGLRYAIRDEARREVLDRLLALNFERYDEEVREGLHGEKPKQKNPKHPDGNSDSQPRLGGM